MSGGHKYTPAVLSSAGTCFRNWSNCLFPRGNFPTLSDALAGGLFIVCSNKRTESECVFCTFYHPYVRMFQLLLVSACVFWNCQTVSLAVCLFVRTAARKGTHILMKRLDDYSDLKWEVTAQRTGVTMKTNISLKTQLTSHACSASSFVENSTKANPFVSPVYLNLGRLTYTTLPQELNCCFIQSWVTLGGRHSCNKKSNQLISTSKMFVKKLHPTKLKEDRTYWQLYW